MAGELRFRIYYADGSTFDSSDGGWKDAPDEGIQVVMLYFSKPYRQIITGVDEYNIPGHSQVKYGSLMEPESEYLKIQERAMEDMDWPDA